MRRILRILVFVVIGTFWSLVGCGGGGNSQEVIDAALSSPESFMGTYNLKDHNCSIDKIVWEFGITQFGETVTFTVINPGNTDYLKGDRFTGTVNTVTNVMAFKTSVAVLIDTEEHKKLVQGITTLNAELGDLWFQSLDNSANGECDLIYARTL